MENYDYQQAFTEENKYHLFSTLNSEYEHWRTNVRTNTHKNADNTWSHFVDGCWLSEVLHKHLLSDYVDLSPINPWVWCAFLWHTFSCEYFFLMLSIFEASGSLGYPLLQSFHYSSFSTTPPSLSSLSSLIPRIWLMSDALNPISLQLVPFLYSQSHSPRSNHHHP